LTVILNQPHINLLRQIRHEFLSVLAPVSLVKRAKNKLKDWPGKALLKPRPEIAIRQLPAAFAQ
jgi:hypothetical protein